MLCIEAFNIVNSLRRLLFVCILSWGADIAPSIRIFSSPDEAASILDQEPRTQTLSLKPSCPQGQSRNVDRVIGDDNCHNILALELL